MPCAFGKTCKRKMHHMLISTRQGTGTALYCTCLHVNRACTPAVAYRDGVPRGQKGAV